MRLSWCGLVVVMVLLGSCTVFADTDCDADNGPVKCKICRTDMDINVISNLPRYGSAGSASPYLGSYKWWDCPEDPYMGSGNASACEFVETSKITSPTAADDPGNYVSSIATYAVLAVVIAIFMPMCAVCCCFWRCCCCCCSKGPCRNGCCGGKAPSPKKCCIGFNRAEARYTACGQWATRICMYVFFLLVVLFILLGYQSGNLALTKALKTVSDCPAESVPVVRGTLQPLNTMAKEVFGTSVRRFLSDANDVVQQETNLNITAAKATCLADGVRTGLPRVDGLLEKLDAFGGEVDTLNSSSNATRTATNNAEGVLDRLPTHLDTVDRWLRKLNISFNEILGEVGTLKTLISDSETLANYFTAADTGADAMITKMDTLSMYPGDDEWTQASNLATLVATAGTSDANQRQELAQRLDEALFNMSRVVPYSDLLTLSEAYNDKLNEADRNQLMPNLMTSIQRMDSALESIPPTYIVWDAAKALERDVMSIDTQTFLSSISVFNRTIKPLTDLAKEVSAEAKRQTGVLREIVICAFDMLEEVRGLNVTVVRLPKAFNDVQKLISDANRTLANVDEQIAKVVDDEITDLDNTVSSQLDKMGEYFQNVLDLETSREQDINFTDIFDSLRRFNDSTSFNFNQTLSKIVQLNGTIADPTKRVDNGTLTLLRNAIRLDAAERIRRGARALEEYDSKYCYQDLTPTVAYTGSMLSCTSDSACSGGDTCKSGAEMCMDDATTKCTDASGCGSTANCTFDQPELQKLATLLTNLVGTGIDASNDKASLQSMKDATSNLPDWTTLQADLDSLRDSIYDFPMDNTIRDMETFRNASSKDKVGISDVLTSLNEVDTSLNKLDVDPLRSDLLEFNRTMSDLSNDLDVLDDVKRYANTARDFFVHDLDAHLSQLERSQLDAVEAQGKTSGLFAHVAGVLDDIVNTANKAQDEEIVDRHYFEEMVNDTLKEALETMEDDTIPAQGWLWFYMKLSSSDGDYIDPADPLAHSVYLDKNNEAYPGDKSCVSKKCIETTIDQFRSEQIPDQSGSGDNVLPVSTESIMLMVFLPMLLLALLACCGAACFCGQETKWQRCPAACSCFCMCLQLPLLFILVGAIFWPLLMVSADACAGATNIGYDYVAGSEMKLCDSIGGDAISPGVCRMTLLDEDFDFDLPSIYLSILGDCDDAPLAVTNLWTSLRRAVNDIPATNLNNTLGDQDPEEEFSVQPRMRAVLDQFGVDLGANMNHTVGAVGDVFSCKSLNTILNSCFDSMCCELMDSFYWYISAWYIIGWLMLCCGCPASILGYKRFPNKIWGTHAKEIDAEGIMAGGEGEGGNITMLDGDEGTDNALYDGEAGDYIDGDAPDDEEAYGDEGEYDDYDEYDKEEDL